ncbi:GGDEF domain-containing response regulator [Paraglaciecola arctica]|uniref:GGDEF domain-containing response regulator n=1 Tax=Paraglaciecola arctica TaxID=1128911 RepID=UPI001C070187|nr:diguanylate cyclase [Paraglaciecola arctica]MBU3004463.1 diguanylate cyclase [Paraglaciecola arctica]
MVKQIVDSCCKDISSATILLVDDDRMNTATLSTAFEQFDKVYSAHSGEEAIEFCQKNLPDLIILDVVMPGLDGHTTCKILRTIDGMEDCPIIFSTSSTGVQDELKCWEAGGTDFVCKPVSTDTLLMRVENHIRRRLESNELKFLAIYDRLTGLRNRRFFNDYYKQQLHVSQRSNSDFSLVVSEIDYFEQYRETHGNTKADLCMKFLAKTVSELLHYPTDAAVRYDNNKLVVVLPNTDIRGAQYIANEIINQFEKHAIANPESPRDIVTVSVGVSSFATTVDGEDVFALAEQRLYSLKDDKKKISA